MPAAMRVLGAPAEDGLQEQAVTGPWLARLNLAAKTVLQRVRCYFISV